MALQNKQNDNFFKNHKWIRVNILGQAWDNFQNITIQRKQILIKTKNRAWGNSIVISLNALFLNNGINTIEVNYQSIASMQYSPIDMYLTTKCLIT